MIKEFFENIIFKVIREFYDAFFKSSLMIDFDTHKYLFANLSTNNPVMFYGNQNQYSVTDNGGTRLVFPAKKMNFLTKEKEET